MDETPEKRSAAGYFFTIFAVLGGALLISSYTVFFLAITPLLLLTMTPVFLISYAQYRQHMCGHSQEPVAVNQSSTSSGM